MKKLCVITSLVLLLGMLVASSMYAQSRVILTGDIPFEFMVMNKSLPAGAHEVLSLSVSPLILMIRGSEKLESATVVCFYTIAKQNDPVVDPKFVFRRYGNQHFLAQLWTGTKTGAELFKSSKELQVAKNYGEPQLIYIAAK